MERYKLSMDDIMTILSNVTMAIHEKGNILPPSKGGWYATAQSPYTYFVAPGFAVAWNAVHANKG
jgi:hypothetical protein